MASRTSDPFSMLLSASPLPTKIQHHLRRVYTSLTAAVVLATAGALLEAYLATPALGIVAATLTIPALLWFLWQPSDSKNRPVAFYTFAFLDGVAAGPLVAFAASADPHLPLLAFALCVVVFTGFSVSALFAKRGRYLMLGSFLWTALLGMVFINFINIFTTKFYGLGFMLYGGLLMVCGFVLYDTQVIVEKASRGDTDHLRHAMDLLIDFLDMFRRLLIILVKKDQERKERENRRRRKD